MTQQFAVKSVSKQNTALEGGFKELCAERPLITNYRHNRTLAVKSVHFGRVHF